MLRWIGLLPIALAACGRSEISVRVAIPGADSALAPVAGLPLVALPYDRDSVIAALQSGAKSPAPNTQALDSLYRAFREPFAAYARAALRVTALRDTLATLRSRLDSLPRTAPAYVSLYRQFSELADTLTRAQAASDRAQAALKRARDTLGGRIERLRTTYQQWEDSTYRAYDSITTSLVKARGLAPVPDTTDAEGRAVLHVIPGRWWIYARSWDAEDPNAEWYWNVPVRGDSLVLDPNTGQRRARY